LTLEDGLYQFLAAQSGITALVSTRIYRSIIPQNALLPAIMFFRVIDNPTHSFTGPVGLKSALMQISCLSDLNDAEALAIADEVSQAIDGKAGIWGTVIVQYAKALWRTLPPDETGTFQIAIDTTVEYIHQAP
jgi:Protein of unknown function (DUF3168)